MLELVTTDRTYFIRTDGNDANDGLTDSSSGAFLTLQHAYDLCANTLHLAGGKLKLKLGAGTFVGLATARAISGAGLPSDVTIQGVGDSTALTQSSASGCVELGQSFCGRAILEVDSLTVYAPSGFGLVAYGGGCGLHYKNINFGACGGNHVHAAHNAWVLQSGPCKISGSASAHFAPQTKGIIAPHGETITFVASVHFAVAFAYAADGSLYAGGMTFVNKHLATGQRYSVQNFAVMGGDAGDASYFPGNVAGYCAANAIYS